MQLALFDFDGTVTNKDSFVDFIFYSTKKYKIVLGMILLSPVLIGYYLNIVSSRFMKETVLAFLYKNMEYGKFREIASLYSITRLNSIIRKDALEKIEWHKKKNHHIYIITASNEEWLQAWCESWNIHLISNKLEVKDGVITGKLSTINCLGIEKVNRLKSLIDLSNYEAIYAYGDSKGDKEMLTLAHHPHYRYFKA